MFMIELYNYKRLHFTKRILQRLAKCLTLIRLVECRLIALKLRKFQHYYTTLFFAESFCYAKFRIV